MTKDIPIADSIAALRAAVADFRRAGARVGLVPTMGALHDGHVSLLELTRRHCDKVIVSIFVNPTQFAAGEDFDSYPRTLDADAEKIAETGAADVIFAPTAREMYPADFATAVLVGGPARGLESDHRPHFFAGVAVIVAKLMIAAAPDVATFGEKDYQQLLVVRRMAADLGLPVEILGAPILREADGLAMSSRNVYLSAAERTVAVRLNVVLAETCARLRAGAPVAEAEADGKAALLAAGFQSVDYLAARDAATLGPLESLDRPARVLAAAKIGRTRLIDNMAV